LARSSKISDAAWTQYRLSAGAKCGSSWRVFLVWFGPLECEFVTIASVQVVCDLKHSTLTVVVDPHGSDYRDTALQWSNDDPSGVGIRALKPQPWEKCSARDSIMLSGPSGRALET
jgi:hypothetical protein